MGIDISRRNKRYNRVDDCLKKIVDEYDREDGLGFLKAIAHNL